MDKDKKTTLDEFISKDENEAVLADDKADKLSLDEPKRKTWLIVLLSVIATLLIAAGGYVAYKSYTADKTLKAEEKIENPVASTPTTTTTTTAPTADQKVVYVSAPEGLNLRAEPKADAQVLAIIPNGTKLTVLETSGDWYKTTYDSKTGWVAKLYTTDTDPLVYKNTTYGYQITFPATWNYKLFPTQADVSETAGYYVAIPTADTTIDETSMGIDKGYVTMFAISVFTPSQWDTAKASGGPIPTVAVQNATYVITYSMPNGIAATDLAARVAEVKSVVATIKFY